VLAVPWAAGSAILVVNNVRDLERTAGGKRTLAVRLGARARADLYTAMDRGAFVTRRCRSRRLDCLARLVLAAPPARRAARAHGPDAHGRTGAQRRAGRHGTAAADLLRAALRRILAS
jgi:1,4-dihydroxy-2-naphthoate octaprenyltransferase